MNNNYPQWKYKINTYKVHVAMQEMDWEETFKQLFKLIQDLKSKINVDEDKSYLEQLENWENDMWVVDSNEELGFAIIKNDDDWDELEYELNNLYDLFDFDKMVWADNEEEK